MQLEEYRTTVLKIGRAKMAKVFGVKRLAVYRWESNMAIPSKPMMAIIYDRTGGQVTANDFHGHK